MCRGESRELDQYFLMLPDKSELKKQYLQMLKLEAANSGRNNLEKSLKDQIRAGSIEVNIMTKVDRDNLGPNGEKDDFFSDLWSYSIEKNTWKEIMSSE